MLLSTLELAKKLLAIPSYVDTTNNEVKFAQYIEEFINEFLPELSVERQYVPNSTRYNLYIHGQQPAKLFVLGHIDTVQPKIEWATDPFTPTILDDALYGLGAADMKGSIAAFLTALVEQKDTVSIDKLAILLYVDEEYDFAGTIRFVNDPVCDSLQPELTLSLDGSLRLGTGCRGLIELQLLLKGKSGHASNPNNGANAISGAVIAVHELGQELQADEDEFLGYSTVNIAYLQGGTQDHSNGQLRWAREGNVIADTADMTLEIRPSNININARYIIDHLTELLDNKGIQIADVQIRHDIKPWPVIYDQAMLTDFKRLYKEADVQFITGNRKLNGYIDAQMVAEKIDAPTFIIGTGGQNKHGANEHVPLKNLEAANKLYKAILSKFLAWRTKELQA